MSAARESAAQQYEQAAAELETAARHLRVTARHFREGDVPRGCAHAWAAWGHVSTAEKHLKDLSELHASRSEAGE